MKINFKFNKETVKVKIYELVDSEDLSTPRYVGITVKSLKDRLNIHLSKSALKYNNHRINWIKSVINKSGKIVINLIEEVEGWGNACQREIYWIKKYREIGYNLTNSVDGGQGLYGRIISEESRKKMSDARKGFTPTTETRLKQSKARKNYVKNNPISNETKLKLSKLAKNRKHTLEAKKKMSKSRTNKILQYTIEGAFLKEWNSIKEIAAYFNCSTSNITRACNGRNKTAKGFVWKYKLKKELE